MKKSAPIELWIFGFFALSVTLIDLFSDWLGFVKFRESIIPITGWVPCFVYMFSLYPLISLIFKFSIKNAVSMRNLIIVTLMIGIVFGLRDILKTSTNFSD